MAKGKRVKLTGQSAKLIESQHAAFRKKFGRDPQGNDPVFFDPGEDQPVPLPEVKLQAALLDAMRKAGTPPEIVYAYKKTGLLLTNDSQASPEAWEEWNAAIAEYSLIEAASTLPDRADPRIWQTEIPELLVSPLSQQDLDQVLECIRLIAPIQASGMTLVTRIELAAAFLAAACSSAFSSVEERSDDPTEGPKLYDLAEELVVRRARELYGQGRA
jgi:hypothetical protein